MMDQAKIEMLLQEPVVLAAIIIPLIIIFITQITMQKTSLVDSAQTNKNKRVVNLSIKKSEAKVVDKVDCGEIENLAEFRNGKLTMCRCWRSKTFPYCDGKCLLFNGTSCIITFIVNESRVIEHHVDSFKGIYHPNLIALDPCFMNLL